MTDVQRATRMDPIRIRSAWEGRISGCLLGKPLEVLSFQQGLRGGQVPVVYRLRSAGRPTSSITRQDGSTQALPQLSLPAALSS